MRKGVMLLLIFCITIWLVGCQAGQKNEIQANEQTNNDYINNEQTNNEPANNEHTSHAEQNLTVNLEDNEIVGTIQAISSEQHRVLIKLSKGGSEHEDLMRLTLSEDTIVKDLEGNILQYDDVKLDDEIYANLRNECQEPFVRICPATEVIVQ